MLSDFYFLSYDRPKLAKIVNFRFFHQLLGSICSGICFSGRGFWSFCNIYLVRGSLVYALALFSSRGNH